MGKNKARNGDEECLLGIMGKRVRDIQRESDICVKILKCTRVRHVKIEETSIQNEAAANAKVLRQKKVGLCPGNNKETSVAEMGAESEKRG